MTRAEADRECAARNQESAGEPGVRWLAREEAPGEWRAIKVTIPGLRAVAPLKTSTEARPRPEFAADPRPLVNPNWGSG